MNTDIKFRVSILCAALFSFGAVAILLCGQLHEDAYIVFQYSKNLSAGNGITFDQAAGPSEGATDFLWMLILGVLKFLGLDFGIAAALLNAIGLFAIISALLKIRSRVDTIAIFATILVIFSGGTAAALGGFSTLIYAALFCMLVLACIDNRTFAISILATIIPLFRPDGVLLTTGTIVALLTVSDAIRRIQLLKALIIPIVIGFIYFMWRVNYFGLILPLPLLVKSKTDNSIAGAYDNFMAIKPYLPLLIPVLIGFLQREENITRWKNIFIATLGPLLLFTALVFARQSQNVGFRFQFPIIISLIMIFTMSARIDGKFLATSSAFIAPILGIIAGARLIFSDVAYLTNNDYINSFPQILKQSGFHVNSIAVTEAGRFPFWLNADEMIDLVGLNSRAVVEEGPAAVLNKVKPDLIFVHEAGQFMLPSLLGNKDFYVIPINSIRVRKYSGVEPVKVAPGAAWLFARDNGYSAIVVKYEAIDTHYSHVYFLSPKINLDEFTSLLRESFKRKISYYNSSTI